MNQLELGYIKQRALQTRAVRQELQKGRVPENVNGEPIRDDMYSSEKLQDEASTPRAPRIGPDYQAVLYI